MDKIIKNGTKVLIFNHYNSIFNFQEGIILEFKEKIDDKTNSIDVLYLYKVLGDDGNIYVGTYGEMSHYSYYFRTYDDHIKVLNHLITNNNDAIKKYAKINIKYQEELNYLQKKKNKSQVDFDVYDFLILFCGVYLIINRYTFNIDYLKQFVKFCKTNSIYLDLINKIDDDFGLDLAIQELELLHYIYVENNIVSIFSEFDKNKLCAKYVNYYNLMVNFITDYDGFCSKFVSREKTCI